MDLAKFGIKANRSRSVVAFTALAAGALWLSPGAVLAANPKAEPRAAASSKARTEATQTAASNTIFWGLDSRGVLILSDRPASNITQTGSQTYSSSTDTDSLARARAEREYWRGQADRFRDRHIERERALEQARRVRAFESREQDRFMYPAPVYVRGADWWAAQRAPLVGGFAVPQVYSSSPGAAPAGPASFIGSGFSSSGRR